MTTPSAHPAPPARPQAPPAAHRGRRLLTAAAGCAALLLAATAAAAAHTAPHGRAPDRAALAEHDGWGSADGGTTGGADADPAHVYDVSTWAGFRAALADGGDTPKIVRVHGTIDSGAGTCDDFAAPGYRLDQYLADYDPAVWGYSEPVSGEQEDLRAESAHAQAAAVETEIPANTTVVGAGHGAGFTGASLQIKDVDNVILRGLTLESPLDCFPQWDPTDGDTGNWNSEYDSAVATGSTHVWIDHDTFTDGAHPDSTLPSYFGRRYQRHDGELDIVRGADLVTVSWNVFTEHDKTFMIGNSDGAGDTDRGRLRVTVHHNLFSHLVERAPRVRFGRVDTYDNHYVADADYGYSFGIGAESALYAEKNAFTLPAGTDPGTILMKWSEAPVTTRHNLVNGAPVDLVAAHNAAFPDAPLTGGAGWRPALRTGVDAPARVPHVVDGGAGADRLR